MKGNWNPGKSGFPPPPADLCDKGGKPCERLADWCWLFKSKFMSTGRGKTPSLNEKQRAKVSVPGCIRCIQDADLFLRIPAFCCLDGWSLQNPTAAGQEFRGPQPGSTQIVEHWTAPCQHNSFSSLRGKGTWTRWTKTVEPGSLL